MRILTITNLYPPHAFGGYEDLCAGAVRAWREDGHDVRVLTSCWRRQDVAADAPAPAGEPVQRALPIHWDDHRVIEPDRWTELAWQRRARRTIEATLRDVTPDVVSVWNAGALPFGIFSEIAAHGLPVVLVLGDRWLEWGLQQDPWAAAFATRVGRLVGPVVTAVTGLPTRVDRLGERVIACFASDHLRRRALERTSWTFDATPLVPHGLDTERFPPVEPPTVPSPWRGRLLFVGRLAEEKGVTTVVRALAQLPGATLTVAGTGDPAYERQVMDLGRSLGVSERLDLVGEAEPSRLLDLYGEADALVFPSRWPEPFGIVPLEAMSRGVPVIATGTGGSGEFLVDRVTCRRFAPDDVGGLAAAVRDVADDPALRLRLQRHGVETARWLSRERTYDDLLAWHRAAADAGPAPPTDRLLLPPSLRG